MTQRDRQSALTAPAAAPAAAAPAAAPASPAAAPASPASAAAAAALGSLDAPAADPAAGGSRPAAAWEAPVARRPSNTAFPLGGRAPACGLLVFAHLQHAFPDMKGPITAMVEAGEG